MISFPTDTEMFQFSAFAHFGDGLLDRRVAPFGDPRVSAYVQLTVAYRSSSRPSSPPDAKASTMCPSFLVRRSRILALHPLHRTQLGAPKSAPTSMQLPRPALFVTSRPPRRPAGPHMRRTIATACLCCKPSCRSGREPRAADVAARLVFILRCSIATELSMSVTTAPGAGLVSSAFDRVLERTRAVAEASRSMRTRCGSMRTQGGSEWAPVELRGFEPLTLGLQSRCSPS